MTSPFITTSEAAVYLRYMPEGALGETRTRGLRLLEKFLSRHPEVDRKHRGRDVLIDKQSLDAHLNRKQLVSRPRSLHAAHRDSTAKPNPVTTRDLAEVR